MDQAPSRDLGQPGGAHRRSNAPITSPCHGMPCLPVPPLCASWPWLLHTGCSLEAMDMTVSSGIISGDTVGLYPCLGMHEARPPQAIRLPAVPSGA
jgi:hypothetical protein